MRLKDYPRPKGDTGIGFHWFPDPRHYNQGHLDLFLPKLKSMGASWLVLISGPNPNHPIPEFFIRALLANNIEPIIRIATQTVGYLDQNDLRRLCEIYASWGVHYIHAFNEPNLSISWPRGEWSTEALPDRFMNMLLPSLETMYSVAGIVPLFTPLSPGGEYWDLPFLATCFDIINLKGKRYLFNKMAVAIHNYAFNKPLTWGQGGQNRWPCAQPHQEAPGCEDQLGFQLFDWYDQIIRYKVGYSLPLISTESGVHLGDQRSSSFPPIDATTHDQRSAGMVREVMESKVPNYLLNNAFWLLATEDDSSFAYQRWYRSSGEALVPRTVQTLSSMVKGNRRLRIHVPEMVRLLMPDGSVQVLDMEDYLKGVVPPEMGTSAHPEALKAQAVAARSYAAKAVEYPRHRDRNADLCTTTHCQVWRSSHYAATDAAVEATAGMVGAYDNEIIFAFYFGHCNGRTKNSEDVWSQALPYCRSVPCIAIYPEYYGHGVGMCQRGAMAMAQRGANFVGIITHYYTGTTVVDGKTGEKVSIPPIGISPELPRLELKDWPRPEEDNGMGIQAGQDFSEEGLNQDLARVKDLGLRWIYLMPRSGAKIKSAASLYWGEGIMPLVRPRVRIDEEHDFVKDVRVLQGKGIPAYLQIYGDPLRRGEWVSRTPDWDLFVKKWMQQAQVVYEAEGLPGVQISTLDRLRQLIQATRDANLLYLWGRTWLAYKNSGRNRPPDYPYDEVNQEGVPVPEEEKGWEYAGNIREVNKWREKEKTPGETIYQDYGGVLGFLAMAKVFKEELGFVPPIICVGGGWVYGNLKDHRYAKVNDTLHAQWHAEMFSWFKSEILSHDKPLPDYLLAVCPALLSGKNRSAWYSVGQGTREETIAAVKSLLPFAREKGVAVVLDKPEKGGRPAQFIASKIEEIVSSFARPEAVVAQKPSRGPSPKTPSVKIRRYSGPRALAGCLPKAGIRLVISDPWGNRVVTKSGTRPDYGKGGFQVPLWADGEYTLRYLDKEIKVPVRGERVFIEFEGATLAVAHHGGRNEEHS
ncbi:MAG: SpoIID/LytB domain-containing protein [Chloroflexi bacterium]|nr:SpoIID/LytB domain-containing protein [Chloroflexota bacterium]